MNQYYWEISREEALKLKPINFTDSLISVITPKIKLIDKNIRLIINNQLGTSRPNIYITWNSIKNTYKSIEIVILCHDDEWFSIDFTINNRQTSYILCDQLDGLMRFIEARRSFSCHKRNKNRTFFNGKYII